MGRNLEWESVQAYYRKMDSFWKKKKDLYIFILSNMLDLFEFVFELHSWKVGPWNFLFVPLALVHCYIKMGWTMWRRNGVIAFLFQWKAKYWQVSFKKCMKGRESKRNMRCPLLFFCLHCVYSFFTSSGLMLRIFVIVSNGFNYIVQL